MGNYLSPTGEQSRNFSEDRGAGENSQFLISNSQFSADNGHLSQVPSPIIPRTPELPTPTLPPIREEPLQLTPPAPETHPDIPGTITVERFEFVGNTVFSNEELAEVTKPFTNRAITFAELLQVEAAVSKKYTDAGYINSGAIIPADQTSYREGR